MVFSFIRLLLFFVCIKYRKKAPLIAIILLNLFEKDYSLSDDLFL